MLKQTEVRRSPSRLQRAVRAQPRTGRIPAYAQAKPKGHAILKA